MQLDFFPERVRVDALDPRVVVGERTRVESVWVVRFEWERGVHQVFRDPHGLYCADHGRDCRAVSAITTRTQGGRER